MSDIFLRRDVNGTSPMDMKHMNDNFKYIWLKVFGNINTGDMLNGAVTGEKIAYDTITAKNIKAGTITAEEIKANSITANEIDTSTLIVGENIQMSANATLTWGNIANKPTDLVYESALNNYITSGDLSDALFDYIDTGTLTTMLGEDYIVTGKILANQIAAGNITGCTIQTANSTNYSVLEDQYIEIYYGDVLKVHLGYDNWLGSLRAYLTLGNNEIYGNTSSMELNPGGASCLTLYSDHSALFSSDLQINGDLNVLGSVTFPSTAYTVVAKFA